MKKRLIIISDLWGTERSDWFHAYREILDARYEVVYYDSCELGNIDRSTFTEENLHAQFVNGGIERAVEQLVALEKEPVHILAFSVGGTIAWKFGIRTGRIRSLTCVSSTRLRKETQRPKGELTLYFGEDDAFRPDPDWLEKMVLEHHLIPNKGHTVYREQAFAERLSRKYLFEF